MNTDEILTNDETIEVVTDVVNETSGKGIGQAVGIAALVVLAGVTTYKFAVKPLVAKIKAKKQEKSEYIDVEVVKDEETEN